MCEHPIKTFRKIAWPPFRRSTFNLLLLWALLKRPKARRATSFCESFLAPVNENLNQNLTFFASFCQCQRCLHLGSGMAKQVQRSLPISRSAVRMQSSAKMKIIYF